MAWHARLDIAYALEGGRCTSRFAHDGPLRILQTLYPEGPLIAHNVLVHPPAGLVGGDVLEIAVHAAPGSHGLLTTPGAARFYRSTGPAAMQRSTLTLDAGARLEWLPLEALCYSGCRAENQVLMDLAPGAELMGWDITALGLPAADKPFAQGSLLQHLELRGAWLERARVQADDKGLLDGRLGLAGHRCMATLFFAAGSAIERERRERALDAAREVIAAHGDAAVAGATAPAPQVIAVRVLAPLVEPALELLKAVRGAWREALWSLPATAPRTWAL